MYEVEFHNKAKKFIKKEKNIQFKKLIEEKISEICKTPSSFEPLLGDLLGIYCLHFDYNYIEYRIAYIFEENNNQVIILKIDKRENFYKELKKEYLS